MSSGGNPNHTTQQGTKFTIDQGKQAKPATSQKTVKYPKGATIIHNGYKPTDIAQEYTQYAYDVGGMDLVIKMQCEQHWEPAVCNGKGDCGFCQIHAESHPDIINDPRRGEDWKWEIEQCAKLQEGGTTFNGPNRVNKKTGLPCYVEAQKYFTILTDKG